MADIGPILVNGAAGQLGAVGRTGMGCEAPSLVLPARGIPEPQRLLYADLPVHYCHLKQSSITYHSDSFQVLDDYEAVRRLAARKKVSASWIVRDAVEQYVQKEAPNQGG